MSGLCPARASVSVGSSAPRRSPAWRCPPPSVRWRTPVSPRGIWTSSSPQPARTSTGSPRWGTWWAERWGPAATRSTSARRARASSQPWISRRRTSRPAARGLRSWSPLRVCRTSSTGTTARPASSLATERALSCSPPVTACWPRSCPATARPTRSSHPPSAASRRSALTPRAQPCTPS